MFVRTERLFLRPGWPEDLDELVTAISEAIARESAEPDSKRYKIGDATLPRSAEAIRDYLLRARDPRLPHFFIYLRAPGGPKLVGGIGLGRFDGEVELGYWIAPPYRGRGYAREAVRALLDQARTLGHRRVVASYFEGDVPFGVSGPPDEISATRGVLEDTGFSDSGEYRERFSPLRGSPMLARIFVAELDRAANVRGNIRLVASRRPGPSPRIRIAPSIN